MFSISYFITLFASAFLRFENSSRNSALISAISFFKDSRLALTL